jgi:hypothetical protein
MRSHALGASTLRSRVPRGTRDARRRTMGEAMATARVGPTRLNGKVERSHRVDDQEFYQLLDRDGISDPSV